MNKKPNFTEAITESIFVMLPFVILILIKVMQNDLKGILYTSDYSLAASIMYGQLLAKTLTVPDHRKNQDSFKLYQVIVFCISIISIVMYAGFQLLENLSSYIYCIQLMVFCVCVFFYIPIYTLMNDLNKR